MNDADKHPPKVYYGWYIVGTFVFTAAYVFGIISYSFTAFINPLAQTFGWSYTEISIAASLRGLEGSFIAPVVGYFVDRWDARKIMMGGVILVGIGLLALSLVNSIWAFYLVFLLIGLGANSVYPILPVAVLGKWFRRNSATVTGILLTGGVLGGLFVPLVTRLIGIFDWRITLMIFGAGAFAILLPLSFIVRDNPEKYGYLSPGDSNGTPDSNLIEPATKTVPVHIGIGPVLRGRVFWHISVTALLLQILAGSVGVHIMPYLNSVGIERSTSSFIAGAFPLVSVIGRLCSGWLGDRFDKRKVAAISMVMMSLSMVAASYFFIVSPLLLVVFVFLFGLGWGGMVPMHMALLREHFNREKIGTIVGISMGVTSIGGMAGPPLAGWIYDSFGTYQYCWLICIAVALTGAIAIFTTPPLKNIQLTSNAYPQ